MVFRALPFALLAACTGPVIPANADYLDADDEAARASMGVRVLLDGARLEGVTDFGASLAMGKVLYAPQGDRQALVITEAVAEGPCARRVRKISVHTAGLLEDAGEVWECLREGDPTYGTDVTASGFNMATGLQTQAFHHDDGYLADLIPDAIYGASTHMKNQFEMAVGVPSASQVHILGNNGSWWVESTVEAPPGAVGFGAEVWLGDGILVVADTNGQPYFFKVIPPESYPWAEEFEPMVAPVASRILAADGNEFLVERDDADLHFVEWNGAAWVDTGSLPNARGWYVDWAFDKVAAFAVAPRTEDRRGVLDRFRRSTGEIDASMSLVRPHSSVALALEGDYVAVSEAEVDGPGAVHLFDWSEERLEMYRELGGPHDEICLLPLGNTSMESAASLADTADEDGEMSAWTDVDFDHDAWYRFDVEPGHTFEVAWWPSTTLDLFDEEHFVLHVAEEEREDGWRVARFHNFDSSWNAPAMPLFLRFRAMSLEAEQDCRLVELTARSWEEDWGYCRDDADWDKDLFDHLDTPLVVGGEAERYPVEMVAGQVLEASLTELEGASTLRIVSEGDTEIDRPLSWRPARYEATYDRTVFIEISADHAGACASYSVSASLTDAVAD